MALFKQFEQVSEQLGEMKRRVAELEEFRHHLRRHMKDAAAKAELGDGDGEMPVAPPGLRLVRSEPSVAVNATVEAVRSAGGKATVTEVAARLKLGSDAATLRLVRATRLGLLRRVGRGEYALSDSADEKGEKQSEKQAQ